MHVLLLPKFHFGSCYTTTLVVISSPRKLSVSIHAIPFASLAAFTASSAETSCQSCACQERRGGIVESLVVMPWYR